ncbi:uncharacterized protein BO80DRAFT_436617 [Aspergillus ibericus CBS 121593]|uniref:Uncharacterized protein n=1 Tax=Aspergillus ibericus CBS 121593 TaxID=1448316 RepID=A0A395GSY6_9EURO|nr:hypothetical protein BO80DRAFT_436617 [Aspergillus ibericus CBS 121593]RAK98701.1 hypothetical protein BO80DRAFT_436617 [Aspergillus ibericus CBS 121593]
MAPREVSFHRELAVLLQRFGLTRSPSVNAINSLPAGRLHILRVLLSSLLRDSPSREYRIANATLLEISDLNDRLLRRLHEANFRALCNAFALPANANPIHLAALDIVSLELFHDSITALQTAANHDRRVLSPAFPAELQRLWEASQNLLDAHDSEIAPPSSRAFFVVAPPLVWALWGEPYLFGLGIRSW